MTRAGVNIVAGAMVLGLLGACAVPVAGPGRSETPSGTSTGPVSVADDRALDAVNAFRQSQGRAPLRYSAALGRIAAAHSADMSARGLLSHEGSDGSSPGQRANRAGYSWCKIAENVAQGQQDLATAMRSWEASPAHRRNLLDSDVTEVGVARVGAYWTMVLATPGC